MRTDELDYDLPPDLIAPTPAAQRDAARLLVHHAAGDAVAHHVVSDLPTLLRAGDLLVLNDTRVVPARFEARRHSTGGHVEGLFLEAIDARTWHVMLKSGGHPQPGERLTLDDTHQLELVDRHADGTWTVIKHGELDAHTLLERIGRMPLPPYIEKTRDGQTFDALDRQRYQTIYAAAAGAVAAPTAGLHFTEDLLAALAQARIEIARLTLHVGMGTFAPVRADRLEDHAIHAERFTVPATTLRRLRRTRAEGRRIIPVGTTCVRALESLPDEIDTERDYSAVTRLLIQPGFAFRYTDGLMTNFHLPRSTLLALVAAKVGLNRLKQLYALAVEQRYRFYSYGDAMLLLP